MYYAYGMDGLGVLSRQHESWTSIQTAMNTKLRASGFHELRVDGVRGPKTWNAMTWRLGSEWEQETSATRLRARVSSSAPSVMADVPWWEDVKQVQIRLGLGNDGGLGVRTWAAIGAEYARAGSPGFEWWRLPFVQVKDAILGEGTAAPPSQPQVPSPTQPFTAPPPAVVIAPPRISEAVPTVVHVPSRRAVPSTPSAPAIAPVLAPVLGPAIPPRGLITKTPGAPSPVLVEDEDGRVDVVDTTVAQAAFPWWLAALPVGGLLLWALGKKKPARRNPRKRRRR